MRTKALAEEQQKARGLTSAEYGSVRVLQHALGRLWPLYFFPHLFAAKRVHCSVADTEAIMGALKHGRAYQSIEVYLAADVFVEEFARALAVFLHEHAHIFGYDGSRGFTDALTDLIEGVILHRKVLENYERDWHDARDQVLAERGTAVIDIEQSIRMRYQDLDRKALLRLLEQVPGIVLRPLLPADPDKK